MFGTSPPGSITTAFLLASHHIRVQFCSNSVTGTMIAPAFALVSVSFAIPGQCRFFAARQVKDSRIGPGKWPLFLDRAPLGLLWAAACWGLQRHPFGHPLPVRSGRKAAPDRARGNVFVNGRSRRQHRALADGDM